MLVAVRQGLHRRASARLPRRYRPACACNRAYDHDLFTTRELLDAVRVFEKARRLQCRMNELAAEWADGLESGTLRWNTMMHRDRAYRVTVARDRDEIELIPGTVDATSILVPSHPTNLPGRIAALKATKTRLIKKLPLVKSTHERPLVAEQINQLDRRIDALQQVLIGRCHDP